MCWIILLIVGFFLFRQLDHHPVAGKSSVRLDAREILRERYARGEIDSDEFNERRGVLE